MITRVTVFNICCDRLPCACVILKHLLHMGILKSDMLPTRSHFTFQVVPQGSTIGNPHACAMGVGIEVNVQMATRIQYL
mgnify:CR=1 FL=1